MQIQIEMSIPTNTVHSVTEITNLLKHLIEQHQPFQNASVRGEVSNCHFHSSGHIYFTLKDAKTQIDCVLWRNIANRFRHLLRAGKEVQIQGKIVVYPPHGKYQMTVKKVQPLGIGDLQRKFEELKQRLAEEGLFDKAHKKPLPEFPQKIGVITSATGAAFQDICQQLDKRYPLAEVLLHPTLVQGEGAPEGIAHAIRILNQRHDIDILIVGRGGGSLEDLWAFNEEIVVRAIAASTIPIVSAVGHEIDYTLSDLAADHRAATPSAAATAIAPDQDELLARLDAHTALLQRLIRNRFEKHKTHLQEFETHLSPTRRKEAIYQLDQRIDALDTACRTAIDRHLGQAEREFQVLTERLNALSPLATLKRGYSISQKISGEILTSIKQVSVDDRIEVQLAHGKLACRIEQIQETVGLKK